MESMELLQYRILVLSLGGVVFVILAYLTTTKSQRQLRINLLAILSLFSVLVFLTI